MKTHSARKEEQTLLSWLQSSLRNTMSWYFSDSSLYLGAITLQGPHLQRTQWGVEKKRQTLISLNTKTKTFTRNLISNIRDDVNWKQLLGLFIQCTCSNSLESVTIRSFISFRIQQTQRTKNDHKWMCREAAWWCKLKRFWMILSYFQCCTFCKLKY